MVMHRARSILVAACILLLAASLQAQTSSTTGEIAGRVTDPAGEALPGVSVTATNPATLDAAFEEAHRLSADRQLEGLGTARQAGVAVLLGVTATVRLAIRAEVTEEITVSAEAPVVDVAESDLTLSVTEAQIENLPILGRD